MVGCGRLTLAGCAVGPSGAGSADGEAVQISTGVWRPGDDVGGSVAGGVLHANQDGCLYLPGPVGKVDLLWPADFTARTNPDGMVEVKDSGGQTVVQEGQEFAATALTFPLADAPGRMECLANPDGVVVVIQSELPALASWHQPHSHVVTLYHCGVNPTEFEGRTWAVPQSLVPFDATNAPDSFVGRGTVARVREEEALYVDESGVEIVFWPQDKVPGILCT